MPIPFDCPHCGAHTEVDDQYAGQTGACFQCGQPIVVPPLVGAPAGVRPGGGQQAGAMVALLIVVFLVAVVVCAGVLGFAWVAPIAPPRAPARMQCANQLKQLGLAMHCYHDAHGCFPPAYLPDENGQPMHSWRVLILPYLEQQALYDRYRFDEPWDSAHNQSLSYAMPYFYRCPQDSGNDGTQTSYVMIVGEGTISDGAKAIRISDIRDGTSRTIMLVEMSDSGIPWLEPEDLDAAEMSFVINDAGKAIRSPHPSGANVALCDGSVHFVQETTDPQLLEDMTTIDGGEDVSAFFSP